MEHEHPTDWACSCSCGSDPCRCVLWQAGPEHPGVVTDITPGDMVLSCWCPMCSPEQWHDTLDIPPDEAPTEDLDFISCDREGWRTAWKETSDDA